MAVCRSRGWPHGKVLEWIAEDEDRSRAWRVAKQAGAHADVDLARSIALAADDPTLAVNTLWRGAEAYAPEVFGKKVRMEKAVSVTADAALVGMMGELLGKVRSLPHERVVEAVPMPTSEEV